MYGGPGAGGAGTSTAGMNEQEQKMVKMMSGAMESCLAKSIMAGAMGGVLGGAFGLFMSSVSPPTGFQKKGVRRCVFLFHFLFGQLNFLKKS
jgi:hypothetical protein